MKVKLSITLDVVALENNRVLANKPRVLRSVRDGILNAIRYGQGKGFVHKMNNDISIMLAGIGEATEE